MAPAPGNESSDWLAPPRLATSLPRVPPLSNAPAQNPAGGPKSAKSLLLGGGSRICGQLESPRNALSGWALLGRRKRRCSPLGSAFFSMSVFRFRAAFQLGPQVCICQKEFPFLYLPLCVSSCLRSLFGISHFFAGFRFQSPPRRPPRARPLSHPGEAKEASRHACACRAAGDYTSQRAERPSPRLRSGDRVA